MLFRIITLWAYLMATSLHIVGAMGATMKPCREISTKASALSSEVNLRFEYDALGRRVAKINEYGKAENHKITRFLWDGNVPLHEWSYPLSERPETVDSSEGKRSYASPEPQTELTTWIFDEGTLVPSAKLVGERRYSIISDYLGTPIEAYDEEGKRVWARELDIYGRTRSEVGEIGFIPFLYQGQYLDRETGLAYNRFRYYSPETGAYISQDPIRLEAGLTNLYAYVHDVNAWVDPWGLEGFFSRSTFYAPSGTTHTVYQQNIDWDLPVNTRSGVKTNLELAKDGKYQQIQLHHSRQNAKGSLFELSASTHQKYYSSRALHPYLPNSHPDNPVNRSSFNVDRETYWKERAEAEMQKRRAANIGSQTVH